VLQIKECTPTLFLFHCFAQGPTFGILKEFGSTLIKNKFIRLGRELGAFRVPAMYCPILNRIFIINVNFMVMVKQNLKNSPSHRQMTTIRVTFALSRMLKNDSQYGPFHTTGTLFIMCIMETIVKMLVLSSYKKEVVSILSITSRSFAMSLTLSNI
jgi:hypothetical protein